MRIGFTCGSYDLLHAGHVLALKESRRCCDFLIVGLQTDPSIDRPDKNKPVQSVSEREIQLHGCRFVDSIMTYNTERDLYRYLVDNARRIDVRFLGADWEGKEFTGFDLPLYNVFTSRDHNWSSSSLRERIVTAAIKASSIPKGDE